MSAATDDLKDFLLQIQREGKEAARASKEPLIDE